MHLALVSAFPPSRGSLNEYGFHFARALRAHPMVTRLSIVADIVEDQAAGFGDPDLHRVWHFNTSGNAWMIAEKLNELKPDAVIFNLQFATFGDKRLPAALGLLSPWMSQRKRPTVTLLHNIFETVDLASAGFGINPILNGITRLAGSVFTRILLKSDRLALTMPRYIDILQKKYQVTNLFHAPHGSFEVPSDPKPLPEIPTIMTFGKFGTYKKLEVLIEAHRHLLDKHPSLRLVIAGSDSPNAKGYLQAVEQRFKAVPNIEFTGYVAEEDVPKTFENCTAVAFPYESTTGSSGVLHQAGQYARAAVMPRIGDLADLVQEEGYQASFFEPADVASLTAALDDLLSNKSKAQELGLANYQAAKSLSLDAIVELYLQELSAIRESRWKSLKAKSVKKLSTP